MRDGRTRGPDSPLPTFDEWPSPGSEAGGHRRWRPRRVGGAESCDAGHPKRRAYLHRPWPAGTSSPRLLHRRLGLRGREGVHADLKAFAACGVHGMVRDHRDHRAEHHGRDRVFTRCLPRPWWPRSRPSSRTSAWTRSRSACSGTPDDRRRGGGPRDRAGAVPVVLDPVMVAESGGRLLEEEAERALRERSAARGRGHAEPDGGARAARLGPGAPPDDLAGACTLSGPASVVVTGGHREEASDVFYDGGRLVEIPASGIPAARHTARAAPTPRPWPRISPTGTSRSRRPAPRPSPRRRPAASVWRGARPVDALDVRGRVP